MATIENPSFAVIEDMYANHPEAFVNTVKRLVSMQDRVTKSRKEVTNTVNFLSQGKFVCLALKDFNAALEAKTTKSMADYDFDKYFLGRFGGKIPGAGLTLAKAFGAFCLAPESAARHVPESVFDGHFCRVLQAAGKVVNIAEDIKGPTPETSGLNHQVFTDVATVLKTRFKNALQELRDIEARLIWDEKETDDGKIRTLVYVSVEELAARRRRQAS
jgi:hypothetical protein